MKTKRLKKILRNELMGHQLYIKLASLTKDKRNKDILRRIGEDELKHYIDMSQMMDISIKQPKLRLWLLNIIVWLFSKILGVTFIIKLAEKLERRSNVIHDLKEYPELYEYMIKEEKHEDQLIQLLDEKRIKYMGSVVLGLNDALVELTGALAGFTLSLQNSRTIAIIGLITGISATFSMAASEYLSSKEEENKEISPKLASLYTGIAYLFTVVILIFPFFLGVHHLVSLSISITLAILVIAVFNYYVSVTKDQPFTKRFLSMATISLGVALLSFGIGFLVDQYIGV